MAQDQSASSQELTDEQYSLLFGPKASRLRYDDLVASWCQLWTAIKWSDSVFSYMDNAFPLLQFQSLVVMSNGGKAGDKYEMKPPPAQCKNWKALWEKYASGPSKESVYIFWPLELLRECAYSECWTSNFARAEKGDKPQVRYATEKLYVSRVVSLFRTGSHVFYKSEALEASHLCHNPNCVNPFHLVMEPGLINKSRLSCRIFNEERGYLCPHNPPCPRYVDNDAEPAVNRSCCTASKHPDYNSVDGKLSCFFPPGAHNWTFGRLFTSDECRTLMNTNGLATTIANIRRKYATAAKQAKEARMAEKTSSTDNSPNTKKQKRLDESRSLSDFFSVAKKPKGDL